MAPNLVRALVLFLFSQSCIVVSGCLFYAIIGEVNGKLPDKERFSYLFGYHSKYVRILREYKDLYPMGRLAHYFKALLVLGLISFIASAWQVGMFRGLVHH